MKKRNRPLDISAESKDDAFGEATAKISTCLDEAKRLSAGINDSLNNMNENRRASDALRIVAVNAPLVRAELAALRMVITAAIEAKNRRAATRSGRREQRR